jgi:hypothetical protein
MKTRYHQDNSCLAESKDKIEQIAKLQGPRLLLDSNLLLHPAADDKGCGIQGGHYS